MPNEQLIPHLFRTEYRKITSVLCKHFGFEQIEAVEDIASDTFLTASETWATNGVPPNPTAWLYTVAKNKARNYLQRNQLFDSKISPELRDATAGDSTGEIDLSPHNINDSQLQMMFAICHPSLSTEAQIALSLRILCGFGIDEIADAFLTGKETINKRLFRGKEKLREERIQIEMPAAFEIEARLGTVLRTIYLLFNEGYYSSSGNRTLRRDLCLEAMRLCAMLVENAGTGTPEASALLSLMCFHSSRFDARTDPDGELVLYDDQDTSLWDADLIRKGEYYLNASARGDTISKYHLEAGIAYWHTHKEDTHGKWENILQLYNRLLQIEYSPVAALNRTYALSKANGKEEAIIEAGKIHLANKHLYHLLLGDLYTGIDDGKARLAFAHALGLVKSPAEKQAIQKKIDGLS